MGAQNKDTTRGQGRQDACERRIQPLALVIRQQVIAQQDDLILPRGRRAEQLMVLPGDQVFQGWIHLPLTAAGLSQEPAGFAMLRNFLETCWGVAS